MFFLALSQCLLVYTVLAAALSISLILQSHIGEDTSASVRFVATLSFFTQVLSLAPAFVFFTVRGSLYRRLAIGFTVALLLFLAFILVARGAASSVSYAAAGKLDLRQAFTASFVLPSRIGLMTSTALYGIRDWLRTVGSKWWHTSCSSSATFCCSVRAASSSPSCITCRAIRDSVSRPGRNRLTASLSGSGIPDRATRCPGARMRTVWPVGMRRSVPRQVTGRTRLPIGYR